MPNSSCLSIIMELRGLEPRTGPCHGPVIPLHHNLYAPGCAKYSTARRNVKPFSYLMAAAFTEYFALDAIN